ncbi:hypothetical protein D8682_26270 [Buttiauxella sp. 3AFRM03]|nr:hypothetical protein D8682_26270 [Buttiauxella sp. 3AFRM03]
MGIFATGAPLFIEAARGKCQVRAWIDFNQLALFLEVIGVERYEVHNKALPNTFLQAKSSGGESCFI